MDSRLSMPNLFIYLVIILLSLIYYIIYRVPLPPLLPVPLPHGDPAQFPLKETNETKL